ncbi:hypothetical protein SCUCBS95973_005560 [Sporothrix curviconia]|uniref:Carboxylic ester hydrolase n=1 Tax=Sporothrix curviconia TaxID=1260050 RepID=A0ABP0BYV0_9PEZI
MDRALSTTDVPVRFLETVFLTGCIPWRVAPGDPRVSYALYVPNSAYSVKFTADATDDDRATRGAADQLPLMVWVHGTLRNTAPITTDLAAFADANRCACLAPLFPANMDGPSDLDAYKLVLQSRTLRSDRVLLAILDEVAACWPGIATNRVYLGGFSGGGQFAHRFLYLHPARLAAVGVGAPGRPTFLDETQPWPAGVQDVEALTGRAVDKAAIARVAVQLAIGSEDSAVHGGKEFWVWLRELKAKMAGDDGASGKSGGGGGGGGLPLSFGSRLDSTKELQRQWKEDGIESTLTVVDGFAHDGKGVRPHILAFLRARMEADAANK